MKQYVNLETVDMFKNKSIEIMPLTVLTGVNGSRKTTILKAIEDQFSNTKHYKWTGFSIFKEHFEGKKEIFFYLSNQKQDSIQNFSLHLQILYLPMLKLDERLL